MKIHKIFDTVANKKENARVKSLPLVASVALVFSMASAQADVVTSSGTWNNMEPTNVTNLTGIGTNQINWGDPVSGTANSGYTFTGVTNLTVTTPAPNSIFSLGTFTHTNFPVFGTSPTGVNLNLGIIYDNGTGPVSLSQVFHFDHDETSNTPPCAYVGNTNCPDRVEVNAASNLSFQIGNLYYTFGMGFQQAGQFTNIFVSNEGSANSASLIGTVTVSSSCPQTDPTNCVPTGNVPLPATLPLFALGLFGIGYLRRNSKV